MFLIRHHRYLIINEVVFMKDVLKNIPKDGFFKIHVEKPQNISPKQRVQLIRKGNELFKEGNRDLAKKLFLTLHYTDGIVRVGNSFYEEGKFLEAMEMYRLAPDKNKYDNIIDKMTSIIQGWINN